MDPDKAEISRILFVNTPDGSTKSIRNIYTSATVSDLKGDLELSTGYPCNTYTLYYGTTCMAKEDVTLFEELPPGAVLKMAIKPELEDVLDVLVKDACVKEIFDCCRSVEEEAEHGGDDAIYNKADAEVSYNIGKLYFVAFISAFKGQVTVVKALLNKLPQLLSSKTLLGRTLAHAAAVSDHPATLLEVLLTSTRHGIRTSPTDRFGKTIIESAKEHNAFLSERLIKNFNHHQRAGTLADFLEQRESANGIRDRTPLNRNKKPRAKSALPAPPRAQSAFSTASSTLSNIKLKKQVSFETMSSGYQTDENRLSRGTPQSQISASPDLVSANKPKKVKFKSRIKSAPPKMASKENIAPNDQTKVRPMHNTCFKGKPFMAFREVDPDELRSISVEYIPMERKHLIGMDARNREKNVQTLLDQSDKTLEPMTPYSSLSNSLQDLTESEEPEKEEELTVKYAWHQNKGTVVQAEDPRILAMEQKKQLRKRFTYPKTATSKRVQSAKYYQANYHVRAEEDKYYEDIPRPRPKGAGPKYRSWKPWLLEMYKQQSKQRKEDARNWEKKIQNREAFQEWLKKKQEQEAEQESSSDDESDGYTEGETFESWLKKKKPMLDKMDRKRKEQKKHLPDNKPLVDRHVTIYELCSTDGIPMKVDSSYTYMRAYQKWKRRKTKYEYWKKKQGQEVEDVSNCSLDDMKASRAELYLNGFTYNEWLGQMEREGKVIERESKKKVQFSQYVL